MKVRACVEGVGAALLRLLFYLLPFLVASNLPLYHLGLLGTDIIGGLLLDLLGAAIVVAGFLTAIEYLLRRCVER